MAYDTSYLQTLAPWLSSVDQNAVVKQWRNPGDTSRGGDVYASYEDAIRAGSGGDWDTGPNSITSEWGFNDPTGMWSPLGKNYSVVIDPSGQFQGLRAKTGDKEGTTISYKLDPSSGQYVPDWGSQQQNYWDTNQNDEFYKGLAIVLGSALAGNLAAASGVLGSAAQGAWQGGMAGAAGAGSGALAGAAPGEAAGAFTGSFGAPEAALGGLGGVEPISTSGFTSAQGGIGSLGAGWGTPGGVVAGEAGGGVLGLSNLTPTSWYSNLIPDWKDLLKQGIKQYVGSQASGGAPSGSGGGYPSSGGGGMVAGAPNVTGQVPINRMPLGGLIPPGASNPVEEQAQILANTLAKKRGLYG